MTGRVWLITGCNGGLGREMVVAALANGDSVFATSRNIDPLSDLLKEHSPDRLRLCPLDVTSSESIRAALETCANDLGQIDIVVNNAAVSVCGELEGIDLTDVRSQYEINVFGAIAVTQKAIAHFRRQGTGGKIIQMSSLASLGAFPGVSVYASAKHALTGLSASVAGELDPAWNIKIIILEAGAMRSLKPGHLPSMVWGRRVQGYENTVGPFRAFIERENAYSGPDLPVIGDPTRFAKRIVELSEMKDPPLRAPFGSDALAAWKASSAVIEKYIAENRDFILSTDWDASAI